MKVLEFNTDRGIYSFELGNFNTEMHAHPALEVVVAADGSFELQTTEAIYRDLSMAIIDFNVQHAVLAGDANVKLLMIERADAQLYGFLEHHGIRLKRGICANTDTEKKCIYGKHLPFLLQIPVLNQTTMPGY